MLTAGIGQVLVLYLSTLNWNVLYTSKVQNFSVKLKYLPEETLEELDFEVPMWLYINLHVNWFTIQVSFQDLMVTLRISKLKLFKNLPVLDSISA